MEETADLRFLDTPEHAALISLLRRPLKKPTMGGAIPIKFNYWSESEKARQALIGRGLAWPWPPEQPEPVAAAATTRVVVSASTPPSSGRPKRRLLTRDIDDVPEEDEAWLWPGRIPTGAASLIMGRMGDGKSTLLGWLVAQVSAGRPWPDCPDDNPAGSVLILQAEESNSRAIKPRLNAFGYGRGKVRIIEGVDRGSGHQSWFSLAEDVEALEAECIRLKDVRLIVVDPIGSYIRGLSGNNDGEIRAYLQPLFDLAEHFDLAVVLAAHPNKDREKDILDRVSGTGAFPQMCRMCWYLSQDPNNKSRRLLSFMKGNMTTATKTAIALHYDGRKKRLTWFTDPIDLTARQIDHRLQLDEREEKINTKRGPNPVESKRAAEFILTLLANGPMLQSAAQDQGLNQGFADATFRKALKHLMQVDGRLIRAKGETDGRFWLRLAEPEPAEPTESQGVLPLADAAAAGSEPAGPPEQASSEGSEPSDEAAPDGPETDR